MLHAYNEPPTFISKAPVSGLDLEVLRKNAIMLYKTATQFETPVFQQAVDRRNQGPTGNQNSGITGNGWLKLYHGSFQYHSGMSNLHIEGSIEVPVQSGSDVFKTYIMVGGAWVLLATQNFASNIIHTINLSYAISGYGFTEDEIVQVQIDYDKPGAPGQYSPTMIHITGVFVDNLGISDSWPGLPTLSGPGALSQSNLTQLSMACDWLMRRLNICPVLPITATLLNTMSFIRSFGTTVYWAYPDQSMWSGGALAANNRTVFKIGGKATFKDAQERYTLYANNTPVAYWPSSSTFSTPYTTQDWELSYTMSANSAVHFRMGNTLVSDTGGNDDATTGKGRTRHNIDYSYVDFTGSPPDVMPAAIYNTYTSRQTINYATLLTNLNAVKSTLQATYDHITANPLLFSRAYVIRPMVAIRNEDYEWLQKWSIPRFRQRKGMVLWVKGKGVKIGYGPIKISHQKEEFEYSFMFDEEIIPSDAIQSTFVYLDTLPGLFYGLPYYVYGDEVQYCAEMLRG